MAHIDAATGFHHRIRCREAQNQEPLLDRVKFTQDAGWVAISVAQHAVTVLGSPFHADPGSLEAPPVY